MVRPAPGWLDLAELEVDELIRRPLATYKFRPKPSRSDGVIEVQSIDFRQAVEWCLRLQTVHDVEWLASNSRCKSWPDLAAACDALKGLEFIGFSEASITVRANASFVISSAVIRERFSGYSGLQHSESSPLRIRLDLYRDRLKVLVSLGGEALYKRGYKKNLSGAVAPLPEHQAAACIRYTLNQIQKFSHDGAPSAVGMEIKPPTDIFDGVYIPFAGTGTLAFEWALFSENRQIDRDSYAFESFAGIPVRTIANLRSRMTQNIQSQDHGSQHGAGRPMPIICLERDEEAMIVLQENISHFKNLTGSQLPIGAIEGDFFKSACEVRLRQHFPEGSRVLVMLNPPYGQRLKTALESKKYYQNVVDHLLDLEMRLGISFSGFCLIPEESAAATWIKKMKKTHHTTTRHFSHGGTDMRLVVFSPAG